MSLADLEDLALRVNAIYADRLELEPDALWLLAKLQEELGELASATLSARGLGRSRGRTAPELRAQVEDEAADLLGFLLVFAGREGIDLDAALRRKWGAFLPEEPVETDRGLDPPDRR